MDMGSEVLTTYMLLDSNKPTSPSKHCDAELGLLGDIGFVMIIAFVVGLFFVRA